MVQSAVSTSSKSEVVEEASVGLGRDTWMLKGQDKRKAVFSGLSS